MRSEGTPIGRRVVLGMLGLGVVGVFTGRQAQHEVAQALAPLQHSQTLRDLIPSTTGFRYYSVTGGTPSATAAAYQLRIGGLVAHPATLRLAQLRALPQTRLTRDFQCVTGWRVERVHWSGVLLRDLLDRAGVRPGAKAVTFRSFDGAYTDTLTLDQARRGDVLVALDMLGGPVSAAHGGPVRLYVAPMYGYKSVKWLGAIEVTDRVRPGYWEQRGYDIDAWVGKSNGRSDAATS